MTPREILAHLDAGTFWPAGHGVGADGGLAGGYRSAIALRDLRVARGERVAGYKLGWTNRANWPRMGVDGPMWGTLHETSVVFCDGEAVIDLGALPLPRLEPEVVVGFGRAPSAAPSLDEIADCLDWIAPGFEIVQSHLPDWRYEPAQNVADSAVHARLVVGRKTPVRGLATDGAALDALLAGAGVRLSVDGVLRAEGRGGAVLDGPLRALRHFLQAMPRVPGALPVQAGDIVTTGAWTDAQDIAPGQAWRADFDAPVAGLRLALR